MLRHNFAYPATFTPQDDGSVMVAFSNLIATTDGDDLDDSYVQAVDCLEEAIASAILDGEDIPTPSRLSAGQRLVPVPAQTAAKAALYLALRETGLSKVALADRLGCDEKEVRRMIDPRYATKIPRIEQALRALGVTLTLELRPTAVANVGRIAAPPKRGGSSAVAAAHSFRNPDDSSFAGRPAPAKRRAGRSVA